METIITLLLILLPVVFKFIGNRLEQSGQPDKAQKMRELARTFGENDDEPDTDYDDGGQVTYVEPAPTVAPEQVFYEPVPFDPEDGEVRRTTVRPKNEPARKTVSPDGDMPTEDDGSKRKREKVDPKKLVIYSEIMKPKYTE